MIPGKLYLIPSCLGDSSWEKVIPAYNLEIVMNLEYFIVEEVRSSRRFLRKIDRALSLDKLQFLLLNEHTHPKELGGMLEVLLQGHDAGLLSEAGLPCVADPGARLVILAQQASIKVIPLSGPSSIFLALMASGFNGQNFTFHGYLPVEKVARSKKIREMESAAIHNDQTQIFIETPYRNNQVLQALIEHCSPTTKLCIAADITLENEMIVTQTIKEWKKLLPELNKRPAVFLLSR